MSEIYRLKLNEIVKSLVSAVFAAALIGFWGVLNGVVGAPDFNLLAVDWPTTLSAALNAAWIAGYSAFTGAIANYFTRDKNGAYFGKWGGTKKA